MLWETLQLLDVPGAGGRSNRMKTRIGKRWRAVLTALLCTTSRHDDIIQSSTDSIGHLIFSQNLHKNELMISFR
jgi:hypothetical protein